MVCVFEGDLPLIPTEKFKIFFEWAWDGANELKLQEILTNEFYLEKDVVSAMSAATMEALNARKLVFYCRTTLRSAYTCMN